MAEQKVTEQKPRISLKTLVIELAILAAIIFGGHAVMSEGFFPILVILASVVFVIKHLPKAKEEFPGQLAFRNEPGFKVTRVLNWVIAGLSYAFLYWGRYNLNVAVRAMGGPTMVEDFNWIFGIGTAMYGVSFLINGPLTDRFGGKFSLVTGVVGSAIMNLCMATVVGMFTLKQISHNTLFHSLLILYPINMYFQSFGAVAIVKINSGWFHVRERGVIGSVFGILISLGLYFAYDWTGYLLNTANMPVFSAFAVPGLALFAILLPITLFVYNKPSQAGRGFKDIKSGDATDGDYGRPDPPIAVFKMMLNSKIIMIIACIEFCSGFLRQAIMQQYPLFAKQVGYSVLFVYKNWGMVLCCAGILGGVFAGVVSDHVFKSRRGPVAAFLYIGLLVASIFACFTLTTPAIGWVVVMGSLCVIGVHGMLSGTASMDFGGSKNTGIAVGLIDGFVYLGTGFQSILYANILPAKAQQADPNNWTAWPVSMIPIAVIGLALAFRIWNATVQKEKEKAKA